MNIRISHAHEELERVLSGLEEQEYLQPMAPAKWPLRDLLAHLIFWNQWCLDYVQDRLEGGTPKGFPDESDINRLNRKAAEHWAGYSSAQLIEELDRIRRDTEDLVEKLGPEGLKEKWHDDGKETEIGRFIDSFAGHQLYHCKQIQDWREG